MTEREANVRVVWVERARIGKASDQESKNFGSVILEFEVAGQSERIVYAMPPERWQHLVSSWQRLAT